MKRVKFIASLLTVFTCLFVLSSCIDDEINDRNLELTIDGETYTYIHESRIL